MSRQIFKIVGGATIGEWNPGRFESEINEMLKNGWRINGEVWRSHSGNYINQCMVKEIEPIDEAIKEIEEALNKPKQDKDEDKKDFIKWQEGVSWALYIVKRAMGLVP